MAAYLSNVLKEDSRPHWVILKVHIIFLNFKCSCIHLLTTLLYFRLLRVLLAVCFRQGDVFQSMVCETNKIIYVFIFIRL